jgi:hypothetical protein
MKIPRFNIKFQTVLLWLLCFGLFNAFAGAWIVDGQSVQSLELQLSAVNSGNGYRTVEVEAGSHPLANGKALLTAYEQAKNMDPASGSEVCIILPPATYDLGDSVLVMDTDYINLSGARPVTLTMQGKVPVVWQDFDELLDTEIFVTNYATSAILTGEVPQSTIVASGVAISNTANQASVAFVKIEGEVFTSEHGAVIWENVWLADRVDYGARSSNTFIGVYAPMGICATKSGSPAAFLGRLENSVVIGDYCLGGSGGTVDGILVGNTITGIGCVGLGGVVKGSFTRNTIIGDGCVGESGLIDGVFQGNTMAGLSCVGGSGGTINGTFIENTILGSSCLGWDSGTVNAYFLRDQIIGASALGECSVNAIFSHCTFRGAWQLMGGTLSSNAVFTLSDGLNPVVTNSPARIIYCSDANHNPLTNQ